MSFYYVSCLNDDGSKRALVTGPYPTKAAADSDVSRVQLAAEALLTSDPDAAWYQWGTARSDVRREGKHNAALGFTPEI